MSRRQGQRSVDSLIGKNLLRTALILTRSFLTPPFRYLALAAMLNVLPIGGCEAH